MSDKTLEFSSFIDVSRNQRDAAFAGPAVDEYTLGARVWTSDCCDVGVVVGRDLTGWEVKTIAADGSVRRFTRPAKDLRPALQESRPFRHCGDSRHPEDCRAGECDRDGGKW